MKLPLLETCFVLFIALLAVSPAVAQSTHPQILTFDGCGKTLPVKLGNPQDFKQFNVDLEAYKKNEAARMIKVLASVCQQSATAKQNVNNKIDSIRLINAQGAEDPNPYIGGRVLLIEFVGGKFNEADFHAALVKALARGSIIRAGFDCAKATRPSEHLICDEPDLARADQEMADSYRQALAAIGNNPAQRKQFIQSQRDWLAQRDNQCILGKPPSDEKGWETTVTCLLTQYQSRMDALDKAASAPPQASSGAVYSDKDSNGELDFDVHTDGTAQFEISNGSARGICNLSSAPENPVKKTSSGTYLFTDTDSSCKVTFAVSADHVEVSHEGEYFSMYCGVHAPDFDGTYTKKKK